jgi:cytochrome P450
MGSMKTTDMEPLLAAPHLLRAFRKSQDEFGTAAMRFAAERRAPPMDAASEECLELLDHLVDRLRADGKLSCQGLEDACIFLLDHLAARLQEQEPGQTARKARPFVQ